MSKLRSDSSEALLYVAVVDSLNLLKIGSTTQALAVKYRNLNNYVRFAFEQTHLWHPLRFIRLGEGSRQGEALIHSQLVAYRVRGREWYQKDKQRLILDVFDSVAIEPSLPAEYDFCMHGYACAYHCEICSKQRREAGG